MGFEALQVHFKDFQRTLDIRENTILFNMLVRFSMVLNSTCALRNSHGLASIPIIFARLLIQPK